MILENLRESLFVPSQNQCMLNVKNVDIKTKIDFRTITSSLDRIKMTENWLEFDQKNLQQKILTLELDRNFTPTNVNL